MKSLLIAVSLVATPVFAAVPVCDAVQRHAQSLTALLEAKVPPSNRDLAAAAIAKRDPKTSESKAYTRFAAGAMLQAQFLTAAWASLRAADLEWTTANITNAAVALMYDGRLSEAGELLGCAAARAPESPLVLEARAMLAFRQRDCATAMSLIEAAARLMPDDMNVHYSAGVVAYRCGNRPRAAQQLDQAQDIAPSDKTVDRARHIVEGPAADRKLPKGDALRLIDECRRFMRLTLARAEIIAQKNSQFEAMLGKAQPSQFAFRELRMYVEREEKMIDLLVDATERAGPSERSWNAALDACIHAYLGTVRRYNALWRNPETHVHLILARAMGQSPNTLAQHRVHTVNGNYLVQDNIANFLAGVSEALAQRKSCDGGCPVKPRGALQACRSECADQFCSRTLPLWQEAETRIENNMNLAASGFESAAAEWLNERIALNAESRDYMLRALKAFRGPATSTGGVQGLDFWVAHEREAFDREITQGVVKEAYKEVRLADHALRREWPNASYIVEKGRIGQGSTAMLQECSEHGHAPGLLEVIDSLIAAAEEATEFDAKFKFDCTGELGPVKVSFNPTTMDEVKMDVKSPWGKVSGSMSSDKITVKFEGEGLSGSASVDPSGKVTGSVGASQGPISGSASVDSSGNVSGSVAASTGTISAAGNCDANGCRAGVSGKQTVFHDEEEGSAEIFHGKVETDMWTEFDANGNANAIAQCKVSGGFGEKFGSVGVACDVVEASAKFDLRAFCGALTR